MPSFFENLRVLYGALHANLVLWIDQKKKRDPLVAERIRHLKAVGAYASLIAADPKKAQALPPDKAEQIRMQNRAMPMLEQAVKKNPELRMSQLQSIAQNPQQIQPRLRTRPGPPVRGKRRY